ncbi:MAG TPA: aldo/keto reductase [Candidatus Wallbacteria bacterium]|nr:aldo/keto reductase [Candidatus Wallbacteria bacterium]
MNYRKLAGKDISILGFGAMRLPVANGKVDEEAAVNLIRKGVDMGVNYVDTAYVYHGGESETIVGKALGNGRAPGVKVATKLPLWLCQAPEDFDKYLGEQLKKLCRDHIDFYLVHALGGEAWQKAKKLDIMKKMEKAKADGRIGHIGFSFHDRFESFIEIIDGYNWEFCQIQYNYMDEDFQAGKKGLEYAAKKGVGVVIMEPLRGGSLAGGLPQNVYRELNSGSAGRTAAEWALRFVWDRKEASTVLSGMSSIEQLEENVRVASMPEMKNGGFFSAADRHAVEKAREEFLKLIKVPCTNCGYCLPCKSGVDIPYNFQLYNSLYMYANLNSARLSYNVFTQPQKRASACTNCGECLPKCPQKIEIAARLKDANIALLNQPN